jgi:hypothetical protein
MLPGFLFAGSQRLKPALIVKNLWHRLKRYPDTKPAFFSRL